MVGDSVARASHIVGHTLAQGLLVDVAAHLADQRDDLPLRAPTAHLGKIRTDQVHFTPALSRLLSWAWCSLAENDCAEEIVVTDHAHTRSRGPGTTAHYRGFDSAPRTDITSRLFSIGQQRQ